MSGNELRETHDEESEINIDEPSDENHVEVSSVKSTTKIKDCDEPKSTQILESKDEETETQSDWKNEDENVADDNLPTSDICRICHMGEFSSVNQTGSRTENNGQGSNQSCFSYLGPLISACQCRGTVGLVHAECLERWLTESGHPRCELCGHKYATKWVPRYNMRQSLAIWFNTVVATRQMFLDAMYLTVTTPLAVLSGYICVTAMKVMYESRMQEIPWSIVAMLPSCCLTLFAYWSWLLTLSRLHGRRWRRYWRDNFVVRLDTDNSYALRATRNENFHSSLSSS